MRSTGTWYVVSSGHRSSGKGQCQVFSFLVAEAWRGSQVLSESLVVSVVESVGGHPEVNKRLLLIGCW